MTGGGRVRRNAGRGSRSGQSGTSHPSDYAPNQSKLTDIIRGNLTPQIQRAKRKSEETVLSKFVRKIGNSVFIGILIGALSAIPGIGPFVIPAYTAYKIGSSGKAVIDAYNKAKDNKEQAALTAGEKEIVKYVAGEITGAVVGQSAELMGEGVKEMAQNSGAIDAVAKSTNISGEILAKMLQGSVENGIKKGFEAFSEFIVEEGVN